MSEEDHASGRDPRERTVKTAGRIVKYSREIYHLESVEEVAMLSMEATPRFIDGHPSPTLAEIRGGELRVLESLRSGVHEGDDPGSLARRAYETRNVVVCARDGVEIAYRNEDVEVVDPDGWDGCPQGAVSLAAPTVYYDEMAESGAVLLLDWSGLDRLEEYHVKPADYFAEHIATAIVTIRSRERLERARNDLAKRKEMVEVYDRLLRHDLGNDLQVIAGFSDAIATAVEDDDQLAGHAEKIQRTAQSAAELIDNVGETVKTLEQEGEPEVRDLEPIVTDVVADVRAKFDDLTVESDPAAFEYQVYTGDLIDSVFTNILSNAVVHNECPVTVRLRTEEPTPDTVLIGMADDGAGIADEVRDGIFEMGQKGPDSDGTGFGLGLARTLVESYGGAVAVADSEHGGADFRITLERP
jgi:signal transduction histidine kinase